MSRTPCCVLLACLSLTSICAVSADEKKPGAAKLEQFQGRWITSRQEKGDGKTRAYQLVLEFKEDQLTFFTEEKGEKGNTFTLRVIGGEESPYGSHLILSGGTHKYTVHYDFQGEKLILVGRLPNRPFEGFSLSGEFARAAKRK
jgi:hypothetical protein